MSEVLTNKQTRDYEYLSRYNNFPYYYHTIDQRYVYGTTANLSTDTSYTLHEVKRTDTLDTLALQYYNNPTFFWVIADFNRIQDPYKKLEEGSKIKIPTLSSIEYED